jgi:glycosyltransferase involved in cell wall biosynthesis
VLPATDRSIISDPPRILFVSSTTSGGSGRSQRELNTFLRRRGVETMMLADDAVGSKVARFLHEQLWDASIRFENTPFLHGSASWLRSIPGRNPSRTAGDVLLSTAPENAFPDLAIDFRPDVVVGSSIARPCWRAIRAICADLDIPCVLYLREHVALGHLEANNGSHAAVLANSKTLVHGAAGLGVEAEFVPSVVDIESAKTNSTRERIVLVNPRKEHGVDIIDDLARTFRTIEFVLQESWVLDEVERAHVEGILARHPNVAFRERTTHPAEVFRDAAIVLAPHEMDNRPRTILEALSNGIPVIANDLPGLVESVGPGGIIAKSPSEWRSAVNSLWQDPTHYRTIENRARMYAARPEVQPESIGERFVAIVEDIITKHEQRHESAGQT